MIGKVPPDQHRGDQQMPDQPSSPSSDADAPRIVEGSFDAADLQKATRRAVTRALAEDLGERGDVTSRATIPASLVGEAEVVAREGGVVSGLGAMVETFASVDARIKVELHADNGTPVIADQVIATITGPVRGILAAERTALNFLGHLSGIASATADLQSLIADTGCQIRDTRKTTPGLRLLEKAAVRDGGGGNHRIGLDDAILVKDNHLLAAGGIGPAIAALRANNPGLAVQVEVEDVDQLRELLDEGITDILLDNFTVDEVVHAVSRVDGRASLEASGNLDATTVRAYAEALGEGGRLAVGAITHSASQLDVALDMISTESRTLLRAPATAVPSSTADGALSTPASVLPVASDDADLSAFAPPTASPTQGISEPGSSSSMWDEPDTDVPSSDEPAAEADDAPTDREGSGVEADEAPVDLGEPDSDEVAAPDEASEAQDDDAPTRKRRRISSFFSSGEEDEAEADVTPAAEPVEPDPVVIEPSTSAGAAHDPQDEADELAPLAPMEALAPLEPLEPVETDAVEAEPTTHAEDVAASMDTEAIEAAEVEGEAFSWRQSPFRQRRED